MDRRFLLLALLLLILATLLFVACGSASGGTGVPDNNGWTWRDHDPMGGGIWTKCVGKDLVYIDDNHYSIAVVAGGCGQ